MTWIFFTLFAAVMQSVRTAAQKRLAGQLSALGVTYARYLFGLPIALVYGVALQVDVHTAWLAPGMVWLVILFGGILQIIATWALVSVFKWRNFAAGTTFAKTEALQTAVLGAAIGLPLALGGWLAVFVGVIGIVALSYPANFRSLRAWLTPATGLGLLSGFGFALSSLSIHYSSQHLGLSPIQAASVVLASMIMMQLVLMTLWFLWRDIGVFRLILQHWRWAAFIGLTSALGSIGWFTAMSLQNPALVKTLGQVEFFVTLLITWRIFHEPIGKKEGLGMALILASVVLLLYTA